MPLLLVSLLKDAKFPCEGLPWLHGPLAEVYVWYEALLFFLSSQAGLHSLQALVPVHLKELKVRSVPNISHYEERLRSLGIDN